MKKQEIKIEYNDNKVLFFAHSLKTASDHALRGVTLHVVKGGNNRFIGNFESIDQAALYALSNNFEIVGTVKA